MNKGLKLTLCKDCGVHWISLPTGMLWVHAYQGTSSNFWHQPSEKLLAGHTKPAEHQKHDDFRSNAIVKSCLTAAIKHQTTSVSTP